MRRALVGLTARDVRHHMLPIEENVSTVVQMVFTTPITPRIAEKKVSILTQMKTGIEGLIRM